MTSTLFGYALHPLHVLLGGSVTALRIFGLAVLAAAGAAAAGSFLTLRRAPDEALPALSRAAIVAAGAALPAMYYGFWLPTPSYNLLVLAAALLLLPAIVLLADRDTRSVAPCRSRGACRPDRRDGEAARGGRLRGAVPRGNGPAAARAAADRDPARVRLRLYGGRGRRVGGPAAVGDRLGADAGLYRDSRCGPAGRPGSDCRPPGISRPPARLAVRGGPDRGGPRRARPSGPAGASGRAGVSPGWRLPRLRRQRR